MQQRQATSITIVVAPDDDASEKQSVAELRAAPETCASNRPTSVPAEHEPPDADVPDSRHTLSAATSKSRWTDEHRARERALLALLTDSAAGTDDRTSARSSLIVMHLPLVEYCARKFRDRGEPLADLVGYGTVGLIKAVDRFDPTRGVEFSTFAMPTIIGEIKRHFRDRARIIRLPRRVIDVASEAASAVSTLQRDLGRQPAVIEIAAHIGYSSAEVIEAQRSTSTHAVVSLDHMLSECVDSGETLPHQFAIWPKEFDHVEWRESLQPALSTLEPRERELLRLRFAEEMSQEAIAAVLGVSQMQVSRLLSRVLTHLRALLADAA